MLWLSSTGLLALEVTYSTVTQDELYDFVRGSLIPNMQPFDGISPQSIAVMDNFSVHHIVEITELFQYAGILPLFLPPYSPDLNPMEEAFSYVKNYLRKHDELLQTIPDPIPVVKTTFASMTSDTFASMTSERCMSWIRHSGYCA